MAENQSGFSGYTASAHCKPEYNFAHNLRITDSVYNQEHIGPGEHENWIGGDEIDPRLLFNKIFEEPINKYNENQKRSDRKIKDYYQRVLDDGRFGKTKTLKIGNKTKTIDISKKPIYEFIIQIGNRDEHPDSQEAKKLFKEFIFKVWKEKFGKNFRIVRVDYHDDEYSQDKDGEYTIKSPAHIHVAFVPVVEKTPEELKGKGVFKLELQHSLSQACEQAGFKTDHLTEEERAIKNEIKANIRKAKEEGNKELKEQLQDQLIAYTTFTSQQRFEESVRFAFAEFCRANGMEIDLTPGKKHSHQNKQLYQLNQEKKRLEETIEKKEQLEVIVDSKIEALKKDKADFEVEKKNLETEQKKNADERKEINSAIDKYNKAVEDANEYYDNKNKQIIERETAVSKREKSVETLEQDKKVFEESKENAEKELKRKTDELETATANFNKQYTEADTYFKEQQTQFEQNKKIIDDFNNTYEEKSRKIAEWEIVEKSINDIQPEQWVDKLWKEAQTHRSMPKFLKAISDGVKGFVAGVKKSYDKLLHGHKRYYENKNGKSVCEYSFGTQDFTEMLMDTPIDDIQKAINECKLKNKNTFREAQEEEGLSFFERHFKRAKEIKREIERTLERTRGISR